jgi:hypothetical protein
MEEEGDGLSPIVWVPVLVTGDEGTVYIDIMPSEEDKEKQGQGIPTGAGGGLRNHGI